MQVPRHWRLKAQRYRLEGATCRICGQATFPPRPVCPYCAALSLSGRAALTASPLSTDWPSLPVHREDLQAASLAPAA